ncbi:MAG: hypothetical protein R2825_00040, partial [Saprospiraceae bacterium]
LEEKFNEDGLLIERTRYEYDIIGKLSEYSRYINIYDGQIKKRTDEESFSNGILHKQSIHFEYDEHNKLVKEIRSRYGEKTQIAAIDYNKKGDIQNRVYEGEKTEYRNYKYDSMNNWIEREEWINGKMYFKFIREIKYRN